MVIKRINPMSAAKVGGLLGLFLGLVIGACFSLIAMVAGGAAAAADEPGRGALFGGLMGIGSIIFFPLFYGVIMFVGGAIQALLYNVAAKYTGGLEIEAS